MLLLEVSHFQSILHQRVALWISTRPPVWGWEASPHTGMGLSPPVPRDGAGLALAPVPIGQSWCALGSDPAPGVAGPSAPAELSSCEPAAQAWLCLWV